MEIYDDDPRAHAHRLRRPSPSHNQKAPAFETRLPIAKDYHHPRNATSSGRLHINFDEYSDTAPSARIRRLTPSYCHTTPRDRELEYVRAREGHDTLRHRKSALVRAHPHDDDHGQTPSRKRLREQDDEYYRKLAHDQSYDTVKDSVRAPANKRFRDEAFPPSRINEWEELREKIESQGHQSRMIKREQTSDSDYHIFNFSRRSVPEERGIHYQGRRNEGYAEFDHLPRPSNDRSRKGHGVCHFDSQEDIYGYEDDRDYSNTMPRRQQAYDNNERITSPQRHSRSQQALSKPRCRVGNDHEHQRPSQARQHTTRRERELQGDGWEDDTFEADDRGHYPQQERQEERQFQSKPSPGLNDYIDRRAADSLLEGGQPKPTRARLPLRQDEVGARELMLAREFPALRTSKYTPAGYPVGYEKRKKPLPYKLDARPKGSKIRTNALLRVPFPLWPDKITADDRKRLFPKLYGLPHEFDFGLCKHQFWNLREGCTRGRHCKNNHARPSDDWVQWLIREEICKPYILGYMLQCYDSHPPSMDQLADKSVFIFDLDEDGQPRYKALARKQQTIV